MAGWRPCMAGFGSYFEAFLIGNWCSCSGFGLLQAGQWWGPDRFFEDVEDVEDACDDEYYHSKLFSLEMQTFRNMKVEVRNLLLRPVTCQNFKPFSDWMLYFYRKPFRADPPPPLSI